MDDVRLIEDEPMLRASNDFATVVGFEINSQKVKVSVQDAFLNHMAGHSVGDCETFILSNRKTLEARIRDQLSNGVDMADLHITLEAE